MEDVGLRVGFIGIGHMGGGIARRLLHQGVPVTAFDINADARRRFAQDGGIAVDSIPSLTQQCDVAFLCLPSQAAQTACRTALKSAPGRLRFVIECSTLGPNSIVELAQQLQSVGMQLIDCPVSGGAQAARAGTLALMCAAPSSALQVVRPVLEKISEQIFYLGEEVGLAQLCKLANNAISAAGMIAACEALILGRKAGLPLRQMFDAINAGSGRNNATSLKIPNHILTGTYDFGGPAGLMVKDRDLVIEQADTYEVLATMASAARQRWNAAIEQLGGDVDYTEIIKYFDQQAGLPSLEPTA